MQERHLLRGRHRRSERLSVKIPILLAGVSETGQQFVEETETLTLSQGGVSVLSKQKLVPKREAVIRRPDTGKEARVRVVGQIGDRSEGYVYAMEFMDPQTNLWEIEFPSTLDSGRVEGIVYLVCSCCRKSEAVQFGEAKLGDFETAHGVLLYCSHCQAMTRWTQRYGETTTDAG